MCPITWFHKWENWGLKVMKLVQGYKPRKWQTWAWDQSPCCINHSRIICVALNICKVEDCSQDLLDHVSSELPILGFSVFYLGIHLFLNNLIELCRYCFDCLLTLFKVRFPKQGFNFYIVDHFFLCVYYTEVVLRISFLTQSLYNIYLYFILINIYSAYIYMYMYVDIKFFKYFGKKIHMHVCIYMEKTKVYVWKHELWLSLAGRIMSDLLIYFSLFSQWIEILSEKYLVYWVLIANSNDSWWERRMGTPPAHFHICRVNL